MNTQLINFSSLAKKYFANDRYANTLLQSSSERLLDSRDTDVQSAVPTCGKPDIDYVVRSFIESLSAVGEVQKFQRYGIHTLEETYEVSHLQVEPNGEICIRPDNVDHFRYTTTGEFEGLTLELFSKSIKELIYITLIDDSKKEGPSISWLTVKCLAWDFWNEHDNTCDIKGMSNKQNYHPQSEKDFVLHMCAILVWAAERSGYKFDKQHFYLLIDQKFSNGSSKSLAPTIESLKSAALRK